METEHQYYPAFRTLVSLFFSSWISVLQTHCNTLDFKKAWPVFIMQRQVPSHLLLITDHARGLHLSQNARLCGRQ